MGLVSRNPGYARTRSVATRSPASATPNVPSARLFRKSKNRCSSTGRTRMAVAGTEAGSGAEGRSSAMATPQANRQRDKKMAASFIQVPLAYRPTSKLRACSQHYPRKTLQWNTLHALVKRLFPARQKILKKQTFVEWQQPKVVLHCSSNP